MTLLRRLAVQWHQMPPAMPFRLLMRIGLRLLGVRADRKVRKLVWKFTSFSRKIVPKSRPRNTVQGVRSSELPRYNYGVWLRHLSQAHKQGLPCEPVTVCELGPGETIGVGLAALLSGAERYIVVDGERVWDTEKNLALFDSLAELFRNREGRVYKEEDLRRSVTERVSDNFPANILSEDRMNRCLTPERVLHIRNSIVAVNADHSCIQYIVQQPGDPMIEHDGTVDMILSHAVMEHVDDLPLAYERMSRWLRPGGVASHVIDFRCHDSARDWNGHWAYSDFAWNYIWLGTAPLINRVPCSTHTSLMNSHGLNIVFEQRKQDSCGLAKAMFAKRYCDMSTRDATTRGVFVQAVKPA